MLQIQEALLCPNCEASQVLPSDVMLNELIACGDCGIELEVISLQPLALELAPPCEEDWGE